MNKSSNAGRLGGFAAGHFGLSLLCCIAVMSSGLLEGLTSGEAMAAALVMMALYFPVGMFLGAVAPWARVSAPRELGLALVTQAGIAWAWAGLVLIAVFVPWALARLVWLVFPTFTLAAPSSCFVLCAVSLLGSAGGFTEIGAFPVWLAAALLAGLLPPLLYNLGNFCVSRGKRTASAEREEQRTDT